MTAAVFNADQQDGFTIVLAGPRIEHSVGGVRPVLRGEDWIIGMALKQLAV